MPTENFKRPEVMTLNGTDVTRDVRSVTISDRDGGSLDVAFRIRPRITNLLSTLIGGTTPIDIRMRMFDQPVSETNPEFRMLALLLAYESNGTVGFIRADGP